MTDIFVNPTSTTLSTGSQEQPFRRLSQVNPIAKAGDTIHCAAGEYPDAFAPANSGTATQPITLIGTQSAVLTKGARLAGRSYINLDTLAFNSLASSWLLDSELTHHVKIQRCHFSSEYKGTQFSFGGMIVNGNDYTVMDNKFGPWLGGDAVQLLGDRIRFDSDMSGCNAPHGCILICGNDNHVGGTATKPMVITNHWGRAGEVLGIDADKGFRNEVSYLHALNCNWDGKPLPAGVWTGTMPYSALQMWKVGGEDTKFHHITIRGSRNIGVEDQPYGACILISCFIFGGADSQPVTRAKRIEMYNLVIEDNALNALSITKDPTLPLNMKSVVLRNSTLQRNKVAIWMKDAGIPYDELFIRDNIIAGSIRRGATTYTIGGYQGAFPALASGN